MLLWKMDLKKFDLRMSTGFIWVGDGDQYEAVGSTVMNI
jgi:hypothetical protein